MTSPSVVASASSPASQLPAIARAILAQAWPVLVAQLAVMAAGLVDTVLTGHATPADLAAMGIGTSVYASVFVSLTGVVNALNPIIAQLYGAEQDAAIGASYVQGLWLALLLSAVGIPLLALPEVWLQLIDPSPEVHELVTRYLRVLSLGLPASLLFRVLYALNTAISRPKVVMVLQAAGLALKVVLSAMLIFGLLGLPRLGAVGAALATVVVFWLLFLVGLGYTSMDAAYRRFAVCFAWPRWQPLRDQLRLGIPMGMSYMLENTSFTLIALLIARLGTTTVGGHQIVSNLTAVSYQVPLAIAIATATMTAQALGAGDRGRARTVGFVGIGLGVLVASCTAGTIWMLRPAVISLYTNEAAVATVALSLVGYFAALHVFDALQGVTGFVLRAHRIAVVPTVIYAFALWGPGLIGGYGVAFYPILGGPRGAQGMWLMLAVALGLTAALLLGFYLWVLRQHEGEP